jgi:hypothetical protein
MTDSFSIIVLAVTALGVGVAAATDLNVPVVDNFVVHHHPIRRDPALHKEQVMVRTRRLVELAIKDDQTLVSSMFWL